VAVDAPAPYRNGMDIQLTAAADRSPGLRSPADDYAIVRRAVEFISTEWREQPSLAATARHVGLTPMALHRLFTRWAGLTPKTFLQAVTLDHARSVPGRRSARRWRARASPSRRRQPVERHDQRRSELPCAATSTPSPRSTCGWMVWM
jgi:AraC-like DNA-binding protein